MYDAVINLLRAPCAKNSGDKKSNYFPVALGWVGSNPQLCSKSAVALITELNLKAQGCEAMRNSDVSG